MTRPPYSVPPRAASASSRLLMAAALMLAALCAARGTGHAQRAAGQDAFPTTRKAAASCAKKIKDMEDFAAKPAGTRGQRKTRISEEEINSYLAFELSANYHPCLRSLVVRLQETGISGVASVDFDRLGLHSKQYFAKLVASLFRGKHVLAVGGKLIAEGGMAHFVLAQAKFDDVTLPNVLVEEVISTVGNRQKPPFDPLQPSEMPFGIKKVELGERYFVTVQ